MSFSQSVRQSLVSLGDVRGRAPRSEFVWFTVFALLVGVVAAIADLLLGTPRAGDYGLLSGIAILVALVPSLTLTIRRLHDTDRSAWWLLVMLVPCLSLIALIVLMCEGSHLGPNRYGPDPRGTEPHPVGLRWRAVAWSAPVLTVVMIGLVATLAVLNRSELETRVVRSTLPEGTVLPEDLKAGECVMLPEGKLVREVPVVPCADEHDAEVFAVTQLDEGPFPGKRKVMEQVGSFCLPAFEEFAGQPYRRNGRLGLFLFYPMEATWEDDRGVTCLILDSEGPTTGTLRHTNA